MLLVMATSMYVDNYLYLKEFIFLRFIVLHFLKKKQSKKIP